MMDLQNYDTSYNSFIPAQTSSRYQKVRLRHSTQSSLIITIERPEPVTTKHAIVGFRSLSGLTWDKIAELFKTSRRSLHYWASGEKMNEENERHAFSLYELMKTIDRGNGKENRALLLSSDIFELLANKKYEDVLAEVGKGKGRIERPPSKLSAEEKEKRKPTPIEILVDSHHDRSGVISEEKGRGIKVGGKRQRGAKDRK